MIDCVKINGQCYSKEDIQSACTAWVPPIQEGDKFIDQHFGGRVVQLYQVGVRKFKLFVPDSTNRYSDIEFGPDLSEVLTVDNGRFKLFGEGGQFPYNREDFVEIGGLFYDPADVIRGCIPLLQPGMRFRSDFDDEYILSIVEFDANLGCAKYASINLENGNRWQEPTTSMEQAINSDWVRIAS